MVTVFYIIGIVINSFVFFALIRQSRSREKKRAFAFFVLSISLWLFSMLLVIERTLPSDKTIYLARIQNTATALAAFFFLRFITKSFYIRKNLFFNLFIKCIELLDLVIVFLSLFTSTIIYKIDLHTDSIIPPPQYGSLIGIYALTIILILTTSILILLINRQEISLKEKYILKGIVASIITAALIGLITNLILPSLTGQTEYSVIGPLSMVAVTGVISYSIATRQFLDIRILFARITYYAIIGSIFMLGYYIVYFIDKVSFGNSLTIGAILTGPINALIFAFFFIKFNDYLRTQVRTRIINPGYDPLEVTDQLSRKIATTLTIKDIASETLKAFGHTIRANYEGIIILPDERRRSTLSFESHGKKKEYEPEFVKLVTTLWEKAGNHPIVYDELEFEVPKHFQTHIQQIDEIKKYMDKIEIRIVSPLKQSENKVGLLVLGAKEAENMYSPQDIDFINGISTTVGLAVTRSLYYLESQDLNVNLQKKVELATIELTEKNKSLALTLKKLEDTRRREHDMVDIMGHELRTPITIVRNSLIYLQKRLHANEEVSHNKLVELVDTSVESSRREITLVETLLSATKVDAGRVQLHLTKIDMLDVIHDSIEGQKGLSHEKRIPIRFNKPEKMIWGFADRVRAQEIIDNLLSNAIKYTPKGYVEIKIKEEDKNVIIAVKDTGMGIREEDIPRLGKKFFRARQYVKNHDGADNKVVRAGGTGIGLYVTFNYTKLLNGTIDIKSTYGKGSTFTVTLPKFTGQEDKHIDQTFD